jgi:small subunit ribosomal protein S4
VVYRFGIGVSRNQARQFVRHGHITVNGRKVDIPSFLVKTGDVITVHEGSRDKVLIKENIEVAASRTIPEWLQFDAEKHEGRYWPSRTVKQIEVRSRNSLVVEFICPIWNEMGGE